MKIKRYSLFLVLTIIILMLVFSIFFIIRKKEKGLNIKSSILESNNLKITILPYTSFKELKEKYKYCSEIYNILACNINNNLVYFAKNKTNIFKIEFKEFPEKDIEWFYNKTKDIIEILYIKREPLPAEKGIIYKIYIYNLTKNKVEEISKRLASDVIDQFENETCFIKIIDTTYNNTINSVITFLTCKNLIMISYFS